MVCKVKHILYFLFALFSVSSIAQSKEQIKDSIERSFIEVYEFKKKAKMSSALEKLTTILDLSDTIQDQKSKARAYMLRAEIGVEENYNNFNPEEIEDYLVRAKELQEEINDSLGLGYNFVLRALTATRNTSYSNADKYFEEAEAIFDKFQSIDDINKLKYYRGLFYLSQGINGRAIERFENSLPINDPYQPNYLRSKVHLNLAKAYKNIKQYDNAKLNAETALKIANSYDFPVIKLQSTQIISDTYAGLGDLENAYAYQGRYIQIKDSIFNINNLQSMAEANAYFDNEFHKRHIKELERQYEDSNQKGKRNKLTSILSSALLIIISLLTISLYRNNQIKVKTNNLLLKKNSELQLAKDNAEKAMKAKAQFLSTVTHELRTPLYAVTGLTHLLLEENPSESQKEHLKSLKFSGDYLLTFINDILQVNKIEARKLAVEKAPLNLKKVLNDVVNSLTQTSKENNNKIILNIDKSIPEKLVGDYLKMSQVFINLISNALKFTKDGIVEISARVLEEDDEQQLIQFEITDNGIGISKEMQENIFDSFSQGSVQINRKYGGTGLGLTIVKSLLELLESDIQLESKLGEGSTFRFALPLEKLAPEASEADIAITEKTDLKSRQFKVLLVEDNKINQVITKKIIAKQNMTCDIADDGYQAIDYARSNRYDFILMDIHMPGISGVEATKEIRKFDVSTPIIALTAISLDENKGDFLKNGFNEVISKPFDPEVFYQKISNILS
ncbi:phospho-acceptor domain-containing protein [Kordia periserrulae]|uniref:histidine kinase n=1 Tax=Kordia periserrulae TaxID=701523 RepID=A0A2T6C594_9FLAO|nr:phospho-acceptor domain-containing protein [Kordia periserrulae]